MPSYSFYLPLMIIDTAPHAIYSLSLHDALPICIRWSTAPCRSPQRSASTSSRHRRTRSALAWRGTRRSEEHTSELQSHLNLVCRLLLEKKNTTVARKRYGHVSLSRQNDQDTNQ